MGNLQPFGDYLNIHNIGGCSSCAYGMIIFLYAIFLILCVDRNMAIVFKLKPFRGFMDMSMIVKVCTFFAAYGLFFIL